MFDYSKLRGRITEKYGSQREFSKVTGISEISISRKINEEIAISVKDILSWCELLDIPANEIPDYFFKIKEA